jgi:hypothetical protein
MLDSWTECMPIYTQCLTLNKKFNFLRQVFFNFSHSLSLLRDTFSHFTGFYITWFSTRDRKFPLQVIFLDDDILLWCPPMYVQGCL